MHKTKKVEFPLKCLKNRNSGKIKLLLVDDQQRYIDKWLELLDVEDYEITVVSFLHEAIQVMMEKSADFDLVISDISMHLEDEKGVIERLRGELAGIILAWKLRKLGFKKEIVLVSTGIDDFMGFIICKLVCRYFGANWIVPKRTLNKGNPIFCRSYLF